VHESLERRKEYPARIFNRATVVCPSCLQRFKESADQCQRCGFDAYRVVKQFPYTPPVLDRIMDYAGVADERLCADLNAAIDKLLRRFPQVDFYFCFVEMDDPVSMSEFGFWMMNACRLQYGQVENDRAWSLLLLIDTKHGLVSLTPGYAIEAFVEDSGWEQTLRQISEDLAAGNYRKALLDYIKAAEALLRQSANEVSKKVKK
jgi:uncharacterized membrane protein YgcG